MPVRTIDIQIENATSYPLTQSAAHLCWGDWRPTGIPTGTIPPQGEGSIRAESGGPTSGTEGYVKYQFQPGPGIDDNGHPMSPQTVYVYWDNPFLIGPTKIKALVSTRDVPPDCDFDAPQGGSEFAPIASSFKLTPVFQGQGPGGSTWGEFVVGTAVGPLWLAATAGIYPHASIRFRFEARETTTYTTTPEFVPLGEAQFAPLNGVAPSFWEETWQATHPDDDTKYVKVTISRSNGELQAAIDERVTTTPFSHKATGLVPSTGLAHPNEEESWTPIRAAEHARRVPRPEDAPTDEMMMPRNADSRPANNAVSRSQLVDRIYLTDNCVIDSYGEFEGTALVAPRLRYLRWSAQFNPVCDVLLKRRPDIR